MLATGYIPFDICENIVYSPRLLDHLVGTLVGFLADDAFTVYYKHLVWLITDINPSS